MINYLPLLKIIVCSAIFVLYYYAVLRNKVYHQYNRFYLLIGVLLSWIIPFISFQIFIEPQQTIQPVYKVVEYFTFKASSIKQPNSILETNMMKGHSISYETIVSIGFSLVSLFLLLKFLYGLFVIYKLKKTTSKHELDGINIYLTNEPNTPFSFLNNIFWNTNIDINSAIGKQVLAHELVHIKEKHSYDKIALQLCLIAGWFNPFFWIISKELGMIHEFIADKKSIPNANKALFAQMLLSTSFIGKSPSFANPFFLSPIKRRLNMLTKNKLPKLSYAQRIFVLPIVILVVVAFSLKAQGYSLKEVAKNVVKNFTNESLPKNQANNLTQQDTMLITKDNLPLQDTTKKAKDTIGLENNNEATLAEMNEYKSYEKIVFTGLMENDKSYDFTKLSDIQKLRMNDLYLKMSFKQKLEVDLHASNEASKYIKLKPTNPLIEEWKKNDNYTFRVDNKDIQKSEIKDASEYIGYLKMSTFIKSDDPSKNIATINFTTKERLQSVAKEQQFYWVNINALNTENNKVTKNELNEILTLALKYDPFADDDNFDETDRKKAMEIFFKLTDKQKEKSPISFKKVLPAINQDSIYAMEVRAWQTF